MKGFEELLQLDPMEVAERTYISVDEFKAILDKRFEDFGKSKATGFIKILEREYDLDLSEWLREYYESRDDIDDETKNIFVVPPVDENSTFLDNKLYLSSIIGLILLFAIFFVFYPGGTDDTAGNGDTTSNIVEEARQKIEDKNETAESEDLLEKKSSTDAQEEKTPLKKDQFFISSQSNLWIGIRYLDDNKKDSKVIKDGMELDPNRDQIITLGHGYFTLTFNDQVIEPKAPNVHRITYKNGSLSVYKIPIPEKNNEKEKDDSENDENESTQTIDSSSNKVFAEPQE